MYEWREAKVDSNVRKAFELATDYACMFEDEKLRSAYVIFAALNIPESVLSQLLSDVNGVWLPDVERILEDKEIFEGIFGKEAADRVFAEYEQSENSIITVELEENQTPKLTEEEKREQTEKERITSTVIEVLSNIIATSMPEEELQIIVPQYSDKLEEACDKAYFRCKALGMDYITLDMIVYTILSNKKTSAYKFIEGILNALKIKPSEFMNSMCVAANIMREEEYEKYDSKSIVIPTSLETCVEILNEKYKKGDEITILGREKELYKAFNIFSKKTKRNAVLVGPPGVGKTAIIEAITQHIVNCTCPKEFMGYTVLSLDVNAMVAGTKYRGDFETKVAVLKKFLEETPNVILFVDEMHQMLGAGGTTDSNVDLSGSLKPVLSRDDVVFVGATTEKEYEQILSRDGAFKRRFEVIRVKEPKNNEIKVMIEAKLKSMERYHKVTMPRELVDYIILCSNCFNLENSNPDKTLDLCDRAMAIAKVDEREVVNRACVDKVYEEYFEKYERIPLSDVRATAYHEIGHYIVTKLTKKHRAMNVTAISIIPAWDYVGVNVLEDTENVVSCDKEYVEAYLMSLLAGRVAQFKVSKEIDSGASNDLMRAKQFAKAVITQYGMDDGEFKNIYLMDDSLLNEKLIGKINEKVDALIKEAYEKTEEFISNHWDEIDKMAKYLIEKKIVTSEELEQFISKD